MMTGICKTIGILMKEVIIESMIFPVKEKKNKNTEETVVIIKTLINIQYFNCLEYNDILWRPEFV